MTTRSVPKTMKTTNDPTDNAVNRFFAKVEAIVDAVLNAIGAPGPVAAPVPPPVTPLGDAAYLRAKAIYRAWKKAQATLPHRASAFALLA